MNRREQQPQTRFMAVSAICGVRLQRGLPALDSKGAQIMKRLLLTAAAGLMIAGPLSLPASAQQGYGYQPGYQYQNQQGYQNQDRDRDWSRDQDGR